MKNTLDVLMGLGVWLATLTMGLFIALLAIHVLLIAGFTVYHLMHS